jgi:hypothetical protein
MQHGITQRRCGPGSKSRGPTIAADGVTPLEPIGVPPKIGFLLIGVGVTKGYELISDKQLEVYKVGRATRITLESIRAYVARQVAAVEVARAAKADAGKSAKVAEDHLKLQRAGEAP